jgi:hypothetical protein
MKQWFVFLTACFGLAPLTGVAGNRLEFHEWLQHLSPADEAAYFPIEMPVNRTLNTAPESSVLIGIVYNRDGTPLVAKVLRPSGSRPMDEYFVTWVGSHWRLPTRFAEIDGRPARLDREIILKHRGVTEVSYYDPLRPGTGTPLLYRSNAELGPYPKQSSGKQLKPGFAKG